MKQISIKSSDEIVLVFNATCINFIDGNCIIVFDSLQDATYYANKIFNDLKISCMIGDNDVTFSMDSVDIRIN